MSIIMIITIFATIVGLLFLVGGIYIKGSGLAEAGIMILIVMLLGGWGLFCHIGLEGSIVTDKFESPYKIFRTEEKTIIFITKDSDNPVIMSEHSIYVAKDSDIKIEYLHMLNSYGDPCSKISRVVIKKDNNK